MELKEWNKLQCDLFRRCDVNVKDIVEVYKVGSLIAHLRDVSDYDEALERATCLITETR